MTMPKEALRNIELPSYISSEDSLLDIVADHFKAAGKGYVQGVYILLSKLEPFTHDVVVTLVDDSVLNYKLIQNVWTGKYDLIPVSNPS